MGGIMIMDDDIESGSLASVKPARRNCCLDCRGPMTWAGQRAQYGRALRRGLTKDQAKAATPRCQKCMTKHLASLAPESAELASVRSRITEASAVLERVTDDRLLP